MEKKHIILIMAFWDNVLVELDYLGMTNKSLAEQAGFDPSNIGRGIRLGSAPSVETAVKIAEILNVSVEYLVTGKDFKLEKNTLKKQVTSSDIRLLHKYAETLSSLDAIPEKVRKPIIEMIKNMGNEFTDQVK